MKYPHFSMWKSFRLGIFGAIILFICPLALAADDSIIEANVSEGSESLDELVYAVPATPVFIEYNNQGQQYQRGLSIARVMFAEANIKWRPVFLPLPRVLAHLHNGQSDFAFYVKHPKIESCCISSKNPAFQFELGIYRADGSPAIVEVGDFIGKKIIVIEAYRYGSLGAFLTDKSNNVRLYPAADSSTAFTMLVAGRADYLLDYRIATTGIYEEANKQNITYTTLKKIDLYMLLNKDYPNAEMLMQRLETIYHKIPKDALGNPCIECSSGVRRDDIQAVTR